MKFRFIPYEGERPVAWLAVTFGDNICDLVPCSPTAAVDTKFGLCSIRYMEPSRSILLDFHTKLETVKIDSYEKKNRTIVGRRFRAFTLLEDAMTWAANPGNEDELNPKGCTFMRIMTE